MRSSKDPNLKPDWESFCAIDRNHVQKESVKDVIEVNGSTPYLYSSAMLPHLLSPAASKLNLVASIYIC